MRPAARAPPLATAALAAVGLAGCFGPNPDYDGAADSEGTTLSGDEAGSDPSSTGGAVPGSEAGAEDDQGDQGDQGTDTGEPDTDGVADTDATGGRGGAKTCLTESGAALPDCYARQEFTLSAGPHPLVVRDLDGDGFGDVAVARRGNAIVSILRGGADGLEDPVGYGSGGQPKSDLVATDLDDNGIIDLVVFDAAANDSNLTILAGGVDGWVALPGRPAGGEVHAAALGDANGDGLDDIILLYVGAGSSTPMAYLPTATKTPLLGEPVPMVNRPLGEPVAFAVGELDDEGGLDFVAADRSTPALWLGLSDDDDEWDLEVLRLGSAADGRAVASGDFDEDGRTDLAYTNGTDDLVIALGDADGDGDFEPGEPFGLTVAPTSIAVVDVDGDRRADVVLGDEAVGLTVVLGDGKGGFVSSVQSPEPVAAQDVGCGDINGDGVVDLVITLEGETLIAWISEP